MPTVKRLVCLANSYKHGGSCIAGKEFIRRRPSGWVRPVSAREHEEVSPQEQRYEDGTTPRILDVMDVPVLRALPKGYQQENWLLDPNAHWVKVDHVARSDLPRFVDQDAPLWITGHSTKNGLNDKIPLDLATSVTSSLRLIHADRLTVAVFQTGEAYGNPRRQVQGRFRHGSAEYWLKVTDPDFKQAYLARHDGSYECGDCYLTISLGESFLGACYKLIAAVIG